MDLAIDIGNSDTVLGVHDGNDWVQIWRMRSLPNEPSLFYDNQIRQFFLDAGLHGSAFKTLVISSVVPALTAVLKTVTEGLTGLEAVIVGPSVYDTLPVKVLRPQEIGTDLVANAVAAYHRFGQACVVVDFGTALTFTIVDKRGEIAGVNIAPGLTTAIRALSGSTAQLPEVPLELPDSVLGKNTVHAIQARVLWGYGGLVEYMLRRIKKEMGGKVAVAATGGLSSILKPLHRSFDYVSPMLTMDGLRLIGKAAIKV